MHGGRQVGVPDCCLLAAAAVFQMQSADCLYNTSELLSDRAFAALRSASVYVRCMCRDPGQSAESREQYTLSRARVGGTNP